MQGLTAGWVYCMPVSTTPILTPSPRNPAACTLSTPVVTNVEYFAADASSLEKTICSTSVLGSRTSTLAHTRPTSGSAARVVASRSSTSTLAPVKMGPSKTRRNLTPSRDDNREVLRACKSPCQSCEWSGCITMRCPAYRLVFHNVSIGRPCRIGWRLAWWRLGCHISAVEQEQHRGEDKGRGAHSVALFNRDSEVLVFDA